jgi:hypothetical protein
MVVRRRVGRNKLICPQKSPGSAHTEVEVPLVEIGPRSVFVNQVIGGRQSPAGEGLRTTDLRWLGGCMDGNRGKECRRVAGGERRASGGQ